MKKTISLHEATTQIIMSEFKESFISIYHLGIIVYGLINKGELKGKALRISTKPKKSHLNQVLNKFLEEGILIKISGISKYILAFQPSFLRERGEATKLICQTDPFLYISHLSAMVYHGLTDRLPTTIFCTSLSQIKWKEKALEKMKKDLKEEYGNYIFESNFPRLRRVVFEKGRFLGKFVELTNISSIGGAYKVYDNGTRVSNIGRTFRDMLKKPALCGGMQHVIEVFKEHSELYLPLIIDELNQHGSKIEKSRAGYLLEEVAGIQDSRIDEWLDSVQRGGSRKLDPQASFEPEFSERWGISINA